MSTLVGFTQNLTALDSSTVEQDSTITLTLDRNDAYLLRRYIVDLEYKSASYDLTKDKLVLLEKKSILWEQTAVNYRQQLDVASFTLDNQIALQNDINKEIQKDLKKSRRKGTKTGAVIGVVTTLVICLLIK